MKTLIQKLICLAGVFLAACIVPSNAATFFGPTPYLSFADIPAGLYVSGAPTFLENLEDGNLDPNIIASTGTNIPPGYEGLIDSVDADDGVIDGSGLNGHSWFAGTGVKFTFPPGTIAAGLVWTDGQNPNSFSAFGPGNVPLGTIGPFSGFADGSFSGTTAEDRFFGVRDASGVESISITSPGAIELDHVQYELASGQQNYTIDWFTIDGGGGTSTGGVYSISGTIGQPDAGKMSGGNYTLDGGFWGIIAAVQTPGAPLLTITRSNTFAIVSWPDTAVGFRLENNNNLSLTNGWATAPQSRVTNAGIISITVPAASGNNLYRLKNP